ncbi:MAG: MEDS domain-containing protein, partial [Acidobacteriota bacterium]
MPAQHAVQFYENSAFLADSASRYVGAGLALGDAGVVVATEPRRRELEAKLIASGLDLAAARAEGRYLSLDAAETMSRFMVGSRPDERRFAEVVGSIVETVLARSKSMRVRVFGEMVALLCAEGKPDAAIALEQ